MRAAGQIAISILFFAFAVAAFLVGKLGAAGVFGGLGAAGPLLAWWVRRDSMTD
jgi:hypothetical protein